MKTAVEWFAEQEEKLTLEFISKKISELEYGLYSLELLNKAKEMEKEQLKQLMWDLTEIDMTKSNKGLIIDNQFDTYWNETFKSE